MPKDGNLCWKLFYRLPTSAPHLEVDSDDTSNDSEKGNFLQDHPAVTSGERSTFENNVFGYFRRVRLCHVQFVAFDGWENRSFEILRKHQRFRAHEGRGKV